MMIRVIQLWIFSLRFLQLCSAQVLKCTVTQDARGTLYSVPEFTASTACYYSWTNITDHVLANHMGKTEKLVVMNSNRSLLLSKCFEMIRYWRDCISEGIQLEANCATSCSGNLDQSSTAGTAVGIAAAVVGFLVIAGLCCKYRNDICRPWNMPKPYDAVMMRNGRHDEAQRRDNAV